MAALPELEQFDADVFQIETDSIWLGGVDGLANNQGKALANRTKWLKAQLLALLASLEGHEAAADPHPQYATDVSVAAQLAALVNSSPATLDTLKELADALGNDAGFAATTAAALGLRVTIADFQKAAAISVVAGGTANAITGAYAPAIAALADGLTLYVRAGAANTTTTPTFSPNGMAAKTIVKGSNVSLVAGDISGADYWAQLKYDLTLDKWVLLNPATGVSTVTSTNDGTFADNSVKPASTSWVRGAMSAIATAAGFVFAAQYIKFPSYLGGFIVQWGGIAVATASDATVTFPLAFPTSFLGGVACQDYAAGSGSIGYYCMGLNGASLTSMVARSSTAGNTGRYLVVGK